MVFYTQFFSIFLIRFCVFRVFRVFRVLGRGAFGAVSAVQKKDTHAIFAMKEMSKKKIKKGTQINHLCFWLSSFSSLAIDECEHMVMREQSVLARMTSPFVLNLRYSFTDIDNAYFIFDLCPGGDLSFHLKQQEQKKFSEER